MKLDQYLKWMGWVGTGGEAKQHIQAGGGESGRKRGRWRRWVCSTCVFAVTIVRRNSRLVLGSFWVDSNLLAPWLVAGSNSRLGRGGGGIFLHHVTIVAETHAYLKNHPSL